MGALGDQRTTALSVLAEAPPPKLFSTPIEYLFAEHFRQRTLCRMINEIASAQACDSECAAAVLRFLDNDFEAHISDEEEDLFPLLRRRAEPEDRIDDIIDELCRDHIVDRKDGKAVAAGLRKLDEKSGTSSALRRLLRRFAANERRHLIVENAIVLPLARVRLTPSDHIELGKSMARRRGLDADQVLGFVQ